MKRGNYYFFEKGYQPLKCNYDQDLEGNQITQSDALSSKWHVNRADIQKNIKKNWSESLIKLEKLPHLKLIDKIHPNIFQIPSHIG